MYLQTEDRHRNEVLNLINVPEAQNRLYFAKQRLSGLLKEDDNDALWRVCYHEAGHKTVDEILWNPCKFIYCMDGELPSVAPRSFEQMEDVVDNPTDWLDKRTVGHMAGYAAEALYNKINLNILGDQLTDVGRLMFYVGFEGDHATDEYCSYREILSHTLDTHLNIEKDITIKDSLKTAYNIIIENQDTFGKNLERAKKYFTKKIKELENNNERD